MKIALQKKVVYYLLTLSLLILAVLPAVAAPIVILKEAPEVKFPAATDSNSPAHWWQGTLYLFNSTGQPYRSYGKNQFKLAHTKPVELGQRPESLGPRWLEATLMAGSGVLYGWYHNEIPGLNAGTDPYTGSILTAPQIGALRSTNNGKTWEDLGIVLNADPLTFDPDSKNGYFIGGHGNFSVMLDAKKKYLYFFFSSYGGDKSEQGVAVARMEWKDRNRPIGRVWKYYSGGWDEPGLMGRMSPIFPAVISWQKQKPDAFWGPSIHWNTYLKSYVMLLNHVQGGPGWPQEGIYVSYSNNLANPNYWSAPEKIFEGGSWYPQVLGSDTKAKETDKLCGRVGRFYMSGVSNYEIIFSVSN